MNRSVSKSKSKTSNVLTPRELVDDSGEDSSEEEECNIDMLLRIVREKEREAKKKVTKAEKKAIEIEHEAKKKAEEKAESIIKNAKKKAKMITEKAGDKNSKARKTLKDAEKEKIKMIEEGAEICRQMRLRLRDDEMLKKEYLKKYAELARKTSIWELRARAAEKSLQAKEVELDTLRLKILFFDKRDNTAGEVCILCREEYDSDDEEDWKILKCGHRPYCRPCLEAFNTRDSAEMEGIFDISVAGCPICRDGQWNIPTDYYGDDGILHEMLLDDSDNEDEEDSDDEDESS